jgi:adenylate cyclase
MAFWGAPLLQKNHAQKSCEAAIAMSQALTKNRERYKKEYGIDVFVGLGIHTGEMNVGNMGSQRNFSYTVIGDNVNLASRVEGVTKFFGVELLTTRSTLDLISENTPSHRVLGKVQVKGKKQAVEMIELCATPLPGKFAEAFDEGKKLYERKEWKKALEIFEELSLESEKIFERKDGPTELYLEKTKELIARKPEGEWNSVWYLTEK